MKKSKNETNRKKYTIYDIIYEIEKKEEEDGGFKQ